jgi:hypothetical protein
VGTEPQQARWSIRALGLGAALFALVQVLIAAAAAQASQTWVYSMQRSLVDLSGGGGAVVVPIVRMLLPMFVVTYLAAAVTCGIGLVFAGYAGWLAALLTSDRLAGRGAGRSVMLLASLVWVVASLVAFVALQRDGTVSWVVGTITAVLFSPAGPAGGIVYSQQPTAVYLLAQLAALVIQQAFGVLIALSLGVLVGGIGAARAPLSAPAPSSRQPPAAPDPGQPRPIP